jgi:hypothetical protein
MRRVWGGNLLKQFGRAPHQLSLVQVGVVPGFPPVDLFRPFLLGGKSSRLASPPSTCLTQLQNYFFYFYSTETCGYRSSNKIIYPHKAFRRVK